MCSEFWQNSHVFKKSKKTRSHNFNIPKIAVCSDNKHFKNGNSFLFVYKMQSAFDCTLKGPGKSL